MAILATQFAKTTRQSANWGDARKRVLASYREWMRAAPEIQAMYSVPYPVSTIRTRIRQEFERNRFVNKLSIVDVLLLKANADYQETLNYWRGNSHILAYFNEQNLQGDNKLPSNFITGFLQGRN
ncbi:NADH-ubiquinone oxidoreductase 14.8 kDa subunit [Rhypophila decipiens]|uniref:NADH-ubiquinone oxidoreductase 14.8 kDa subunit n=1 Tax=Rhypophila decipiens TaxID=261697 RepID=A0AAN6Y9H4_9PEZI|nr:NADH-ubiquinone oxidoreductase 14.8 kDa subunit [Rhypophila decipiens]